MRQVVNYLILIKLATVLSFLAFLPSQSDFIQIITLYTAAYFLFLTLLFIKPNKIDVKEWLLILIVLPLPLLFSFPNLSDDIYRFVWDGYCIQGGISPYRFLPIDLLDQGIHGLDQSLYFELNSPEYFSIYPTIGQFMFWICTIFSDDIHIQSIILKSLYFLLHVCGGIAIWKVFYNKGWSKIPLLFYYANPLVLIEGLGNLHAEINMVSFLFIAFYFWNTKKDTLSALFFGFAIMVKLIPVFLLGYFLIRYKERRFKNYLFKVGLFTILLSIPIIYGLINGGFLYSIDLYFRKFEFNASLYYLLRELGFVLSGYNLIKYIGPGMFLCFVAINFYNWNKFKNKSGMLAFFKSAEFTIFSYLILSTIIHPWYVITLVAISIFTHQKYILVWAYLVFMTYINYSYEPYSENMWVVFFEYVAVFIVYFYEKDIVKKKLLGAHSL